MLKVMFAWNGKHADEFSDENSKFRSEVLSYYEKEPTDFPLELVRDLFEAETEYAREVWGVKPVVSKLSKDLLEIGREKYLKDWVKGIGRGMDAYIQALEIRLTEDVAKYLLSYCKENITSGIFPTKEIANHVVEFFEYQTKRH